MMDTPAFAVDVAGHRDAINGSAPSGSRGRHMTAVPRTAAVRASAGCRTQQPLRGSQREHAGQHPPSAIAAYLSKATANWLLAMSHLSITLIERKGSCAHRSTRVYMLAVRARTTSKPLQANLPQNFIDVCDGVVR